MGKKGATATGKTAISKEESSFAQDSADTGLTGILASEVSLQCNKYCLPPIGVYLKGSGNECRFAFMIDIDASDQDCITVLYIRGWLVSDVVATVLLNSLISIKTLSALSLWNVGLTPSTLAIISQILSEHNIRELCLDGNSLTSAPVIDCLQCKSLVKLSMKSCKLTDSFALEIVPYIGNLLHLNMSCNSIGDDGCVSLATALRLNRTLLTLSLTGNCIGDTGASCLAEVISRFPLKHSEVVQRRKFLSRLEDIHSSLILDVQVEKSRVASPRGKSPNSSTALNKSSSKVSSVKQKKGDVKKDDKSKKLDDKNKKTLELKKGKPNRDQKNPKKGETGTDSPHPESVHTVNPLNDPELQVKTENGQLYIPGNTTLVYLTLAYNRIGSTGMQNLLKALKIQSEYLETGPGLLRLTLHNNSQGGTGTTLNGARIETGSTECIIAEIESLLAKKNLDDRMVTDQREKQNE